MSVFKKYPPHSNRMKNITFVHEIDEKWKRQILMTTQLFQCYTLWNHVQIVVYLALSLFSQWRKVQFIIRNILNFVKLSDNKELLEHGWMVRQKLTAVSCIIFRVHERQCDYVTLYFVTRAPILVTRDKLRFNVASCDNYRSSVHDIMTHKNHMTSWHQGRMFFSCLWTLQSNRNTQNNCW